MSETYIYLAIIIIIIIVFLWFSNDWHENLWCGCNDFRRQEKKQTKEINLTHANRSMYKLKMCINAIQSGKSFELNKKTKKVHSKQSNFDSSLQICDRTKYARQSKIVLVERVIFSEHEMCRRMEDQRRVPKRRGRFMSTHCSLYKVNDEKRKKSNRKNRINYT